MTMYSRGRCEDYRLQYSFQSPTAAQLQLHLQALLAELPPDAAARQRWTPSDAVSCRAWAATRCELTVLHGMCLTSA